MSNDAFRKVLEEMSAEYRGSLPDRLLEIDVLWSGLARGAEPVSRMTDLRRLLHTIAGSAKTFGLPGVSAAAKAAETFLDPFCGPEEGPPDGVAPSCSLPQEAQRPVFAALLDALKLSAKAT